MLYQHVMWKILSRETIVRRWRAVSDVEAVVRATADFRPLDKKLGPYAANVELRNLTEEYERSGETMGYRAPNLLKAEGVEAGGR